jgi:rhomboid-like protein
MSAFVLLICAASYGFGHYYTAPSSAYRLWPDLSPTTATLLVLGGLNLGVCLLWRITPLWPLLIRYFMHVPGQPRDFQALGNIFSHIHWEHFFGNMLFLALIGSVCHDLVGRGVFLGTYVSAGALGTITSLYWANLGRGSISGHSVGAWPPFGE